MRSIGLALGLGGLVLSGCVAQAGATVEGRQIDWGVFGVCQGGQGTGTPPRAYVGVQDVMQNGLPARVERWWLDDATWNTDVFTWTFLYLGNPVPMNARPAPVAATGWTAIKATVVTAPADVWERTLPPLLTLPTADDPQSGVEVDKRLRARAYTVRQASGGLVVGYLNAHDRSGRKENWLLKTGTDGWKMPGAANPTVTWYFVPHVAPLHPNGDAGNDTAVPTGTVNGWARVWTTVVSYTVEGSTAAVTAPGCP